MKDRGKFNNPYILLAIITVAGAFLRFNNYSDLSFFNDELSALTRLRFNNINDLIVKGIITDVHPAGIPFLLYLWTHLFGVSETIVRLPFVLAGIISIPVLYLTGRQWFNEKTGLLAAAALAVLQYPVYFSQLARPYSIGLMTALLMVYFWTRLVQQPAAFKDNRKHYIGFILFGAANMYIHYFSILFTAIVGIVGLFMVSKQTLKYYIMAGAAILLLAAPHYPIYEKQLLFGGLGGQGGWLAPPDADTFRKYILYIFNDSNWVYFLFSGICIGSFIVYRKTLSLTPYHLLCLLFFLLPYAVAYFYSVFKNPILQYSGLFFSFPFFLLLLFSFLPANLDPVKTLTLTLAILLTGGVSTVIEKKFYTTEHFGVFRELAEKTIELNNRYGDQNITNTFNVYEPFYVDYYFDKFKRPVEIAQYRNNQRDSMAVFRDIVDKSSTPYFLHAWSNIFEPPETEEIILRQYPFLVLNDRHFNSGLSFYAKKPNDSTLTPSIIFTAVHDFENYKWPNDQNFVSREHVHTGQYASNLSGMEYGNTFHSTLKEMGFREGLKLSVSCWVYSNEKNTGAEIVATIQDPGGQTLFWQAGSLDAYNQAPGTWQQVFFSCIPTGKFTPMCRLSIFPWNINKKKLWIDDLEINLKKP